MDTIDKLIKALEEAKEELNKNMNASYGATTPNMTKEEIEKGAANPALAPKEVKIKKLQAQIDAGTYKPNASKIADKMLQKEEDGVEELHCSANGQWSLHKAKRGAYQAPSVANVGKDVVGRTYSGVSGSSKQQLFHEGKNLKAKNAAQPVKVYNEQEKAALSAKMGLKKED